MADPPLLSPAEHEELERSLEHLERCLASGNVAGAQSALSAAERLAGEADPDVTYGRALIAFEQGKLESAIQTLTALVEEDPEFADAHYTLALALEERGDEAGMLHHFLCTHALDRELEQDLIEETVLDRIEQAARRTLEALPPDLAAHLTDLPITLETRPSEEEVSHGRDPRALALLEASAEGDRPRLRLVLFAATLVAYFDEPDLESEVAICIRHEVGRYFGLDDAEV